MLGPKRGLGFGRGGGLGGAECKCTVPEGGLGGLEEVRLGRGGGGRRGLGGAWGCRRVDRDGRVQRASSLLLLVVLAKGCARDGRLIKWGCQLCYQAHVDWLASKFCSYLQVSRLLKKAQRCATGA